jgi:hypothetical protein
MSYDTFTLVRMTKKAVQFGYYIDRSDELYEIKIHPEWLFFIANFRYRIVLFLFLSNSSAIQLHPFIYGNWNSSSYTRTTDYYTFYPIRAYTDENLYRYFDRLLR